MASPSRSEQPSPRPNSRESSVSLSELLRKVLDELAELIARRNAEVEVGRTAENLIVRGPEQAVHQIIYQVLRNAVEASPSRGLVRVCQHQLPGEVVFEVTDEGTGIAAPYMSKIFKRGFTTKPGAKGQGLAEVEACIGRLRGAIAWESPLRSGKGCRFTVTLPAGSAPAPAVSN
jgi:signal transduction histidine kinase